jgi:hypothetical protein
MSPLPTLLWIYAAVADFADRRIISAIKYQHEIYFPTYNPNPIPVIT